MSEVQDWRITKLEEELTEAQARIRELEDDRSRLLGMSDVAKWGYRLLIALGGYGLITVLHKVSVWLNGPMK